MSLPECARCGESCPSMHEMGEYPLCSGCDEQLGWVAEELPPADEEEAA